VVKDMIQSIKTQATCSFPVQPTQSNWTGLNTIGFYADGLGIVVFFDGHAEGRKPDTTSLIQGRIPMIRPPDGQRSIWNRFWSGNDKASGT
jgi:hypothetical protein